MSAATQLAPQDFLTYEEAAAYLGITVSALRQAISAGNIHPHKFPHIARKYLTHQQLDDYRAGKHRRAITPETAASAAVSALVSHEELAARVRILSEPTLTALREGQATLREGLDSLRSIAVATARGMGIGAIPGTSQGQSQAGEGGPDPKR